MDEKVEKFLLEATKAFSFLENEYGFIVSTDLQSPNYFPDSEAVVSYYSSKIGIKVFWYFASAVIGVAFAELEDGKFPNNQSKDISIINIYALVDVINQGKDDTFLLKDISDTTISKIKRREKIINEDMRGVLDNLSRVVKKYAINIINGDTSIFPVVKKYQEEVIRRRYS